MPTMPVASSQDRETPRLLRVDNSNDSETFSSAEMAAVSSIKGKTGGKKKNNANNNKRRARFFPQVKVRDTDHIFDMTQEEIDNTWYSPKDMSVIKSELVKDMRKIISGGPLIKKGGKGSDDIVTVRGLEDCVRIKEQKSNNNSQKKKKRSKNKKDVIYAVLDLQDEQYQSGEFDPEAIRAMYASESEEFTNEAQVLGKIDEVEASLIHEVYTTKKDHNNSNKNTSNKKQTRRRNSNR